MTRQVKQGSEIVNDVWSVAKDINVVPVYKYGAPLKAGGLPSTEYAVVNLLSAQVDLAYNALVIVNIHVPNIGIHPNVERMEFIAWELLSTMDYYSGSDFLLTTDVAGRLNTNADGTYFYTLRFFYETTIKQF